MTLVALDGSLEITGPSGTRTVPAGEFFTGFFETVLEPDEMLTAVRVPRTGSAPWGYQKFVRRANDWATTASTAGASKTTNATPTPTSTKAGCAASQV